MTDKNLKQKLTQSQSELARTLEIIKKLEDERSKLLDHVVPVEDARKVLEQKKESK